jgi:RNA polymerase-interacting CarD/CdnL/TRCF family regulator
MGMKRDDLIFPNHLHTSVRKNNDSRAVANSNFYTIGDFVFIAASCDNLERNEQNRARPFSTRRQN